MGPVQVELPSLPKNKQVGQSVQFEFHIHNEYFLKLIFFVIFRTYLTLHIIYCWSEIQIKLGSLHITCQP